MVKFPDVAFVFSASGEVNLAALFSIVNVIQFVVVGVPLQIYLVFIYFSSFCMLCYQLSLACNLWRLVFAVSGVLWATDKTKWRPNHHYTHKFKWTALHFTIPNHIRKIYTHTCILTWQPFAKTDKRDWCRQFINWINLPSLIILSLEVISIAEKYVSPVMIYSIGSWDLLYR